MADDTPAGKLAAAREMITKQGKPMTAENLNRASLALSRNEESTDFDDVVERAANPTRRTARPAGKAPTPPTKEGPAAKPVEPAQKAAAVEQDTTAGKPGAGKNALTPEQYVDGIIAAESAGQNALMTPAPKRATPAYVDLPLEERAPRGAQAAPPPGATAPVQSNPAANAAALQAPAQDQPAIAEAAQQPMSFRDYLAQRGGTQGFVESEASNPGMGLLFGGRGMNTGAGVAGGARGAATSPLPRGPLPPGSVNPPGPAGLSAPPPQAALPSSYGPPMPRGNPNMAAPPDTIPLQGGPSQAYMMPKPSYRVPAGRASDIMNPPGSRPTGPLSAEAQAASRGGTQDNTISNIEALVRALRSGGPGARPSAARPPTPAPTAAPAPAQAAPMPAPVNTSDLVMQYLRSVGQ